MPAALDGSSGHNGCGHSKPPKSATQALAQRPQHRDTDKDADTQGVIFQPAGRSFYQCGTLSFRALTLPVPQKPKLHDIHGMVLSFLAERTSDGRCPAFWGCGEAWQR
jgi:hypothetical protein